MSSWSVDTFSCTSKEKQTKIIYTNVYVRRWGQTTPQRSDQSVTILVNLGLLCFNSFLTKLGLKIRNIRPIKMAHRITSNVKLWRHICWRHSYVNFKLLNFWIFWSWKLKKIFQYVKYELRYDILNLDKSGAQEWDSLPPLPPFPLVK